MTGGWRSEKRLMGKPLARVRSAERPGNAGSITAADQIAVIEQALQQIPAEQIADVEIVVRADSAGATHDLLDFCARAACATRSATSSASRCAPRS